MNNKIKEAQELDTNKAQLGVNLAKETQVNRQDAKTIKQNIVSLEKEIANQQSINTSYRLKLNSLQVDFEGIMAHLESSQNKVETRLQRIEAEMLEVAKQQRELFCLMMLGKNTTLNHEEMLGRANYIENKELREIIELRFFPNTRKERSDKLQVTRIANEQMVDLNINSVLLALEKIKQKLNNAN